MMSWARRLAIPVLLLASILCAAQEAELPKVQLNADNTAGKTLEDLTEKAVARDYAKAWRTMADAIDKNQAEDIGKDFVGVAQDKLAAAVEQQAKAGLHQRYVDRGHNVDVVFYSPDGTSIQLRDTARLELQFMDGDKVLHSENVTRRYIAVMTPTEVRWKVRVLQEVEK